MNEKKKILFIITKSAWGGAQRYVFDIASHLPAEDFEAVVAVGGSGPLIEKLRQKSIRVIPIASLNRDVRIVGDAVSFFKIFFLCMREKPDVVHLNSSKIGVLGAFAAFLAKLTTRNYKQKIIFTAHGWAWNEPRVRWQKRLIAAGIKIAARFQDSIIILSRRDLAEALARGIPQEKLTVIPLGIPENTRFLAPLDAQKALSEKVGITFERPLFGTIAELTKNKGLPYLIQALHAVKQKTPHFSCVIIGDGEDRETLRRMVSENGLAHTIFFAGFIPDASRYLKVFDFFVLPSIKEGLPYVLLEALSANIPIIATDVGGIPDIVEHNINGIIVPPRNIAALTEAIERCMAPHLRDTYSKNTLKKIREFSFSDMMQKTIALYS